MKEIVENIIPLERDLFLLLNGSDSVFLDNVMWTISGRFVWVPLLLFLVFLFFYKTLRKEALLVTLFFILLFVACDQVSSGLIKPLFERLRPSHHPDFMDVVDLVNNYRGGRFGFISGHATNSFGLAVFLSLLFKNRRLTIASLIWATINSYSRIYLGVHFISDIIGGVIVGTIIGIIIYQMYSYFRYRMFTIPDRLRRKSAYSLYHGNMLAIFIISCLVIITIFNQPLSQLPH